MAATPETLAEMLANRLRKRARHLRKWARREGIDAYRVYDRDIPELPLAIDRYLDHLHVAEYARTTSGDGPPVGWLDACVAAAAATLEVRPDSVHVKRRERQRGKAQYSRMGESARRLIVEERGLSFAVNLDDYLDTGLFLDHRRTRARIRDEAADKDVLNLFGYTGSFSVYAADGGARTTTTIDLSTTYLEWARENFLLNGFDDFERHRLVRDDVIGTLDRGGSVRPAFDVVIVDPPTFSNSKRMARSFDLRRDHAPLLRFALAHLRPGGVVYFSTNARRFRLADADVIGAHGEEITEHTVPLDFRRRRPHRCWRFVVQGRG